jgi:hypothetical protein
MKRMNTHTSKDFTGAARSSTRIDTHDNNKILIPDKLCQVRCSN